MKPILPAVLLAVTVAVPTAAWSGSAAAQAKKSATKKSATINTDDPAMRRAHKKARKSLASFLKKANAAPKGVSSFALKVGVPQGNSHRFIWVSNFRASGDKIVARITEKPADVKSVKTGQVYQFSRSQVVDWTYLNQSNGKMVGNFTACASLARASASEKRAVIDRYGIDCD